MFIGACTDLCVDMLIDMHIEMCLDMCVHMWMGVCIDMRVGMNIRVSVHRLAYKHTIPQSSAPIAMCEMYRSSVFYAAHIVGASLVGK